MNIRSLTDKEQCSNAGTKIDCGTSGMERVTMLGNATSSREENTKRPNYSADNIAGLQ